MISSIRNMGERGATAVASIKPYLQSKIYAVRTAAREALDVLEPFVRRRNFQSRVSGIRIPKSDADWLDKQTANIQLGGMGDDLPDDPVDQSENKDDTKKTQGGRLAELKVPVTGMPPMFAVMCNMYSGGNWDAAQAIATGNIEIEVKVLMFSMKVLNLGSDYLLKKGINMSESGSFTYADPESESAFTFTVIGKTVLADKEILTEQVPAIKSCPLNPVSYRLPSPPHRISTQAVSAH